MPVVQLTQSMLQTLKPLPGKARTEYCDDAHGVPGLYVLVSTGSPIMTFYLRYKDSAGKTCHQKIGRTTEVTLTEARKQAKVLKAEITANGRDPRAEAKAKQAEPTLNDLWEDYEKYAKPRKRSFTRDEQLWRIRLEPKFGKLRLSQITRHQVQAFHTSLKAEGLSGASADHHVKLLRRMLNLAVEWSLLKASPLTGYRLFDEPNMVEHYLDQEQLQRLVAVLKTDANRPVSLICMFLLATGCRLNEALTAQWLLVDRENRVWRIPANDSKSGKVRSVPLSDTALDALDQIGTEDKYEYVFTNLETGTRYTHITHTWHRLRVKAGLPRLRLHDLRHSFASMLVNAGRTLYEVQQCLGHADSRVTQRYAHLSSKTLQDAANTASSAIQRAMKEVA